MPPKRTGSHASSARTMPDPGGEGVRRDHAGAFGRPAPPANGLRSASSSSRRGSGLGVVDHDRRPRPGVAAVTGVGLARGQVGLVDPAAAVPVAGGAVGGAHVVERLVGVGEDDLLGPRSQPRLATTWEKASSAGSVGLERERTVGSGYCGRSDGGPDSGCSRAWRAASSATTASKCAALGRPTVSPSVRSRRSAATRRAPRTGAPAVCGEPPGPLGGGEDVLLGVGAVRHLGGDVEPLGQERRHRLVVGLAGRLLRAARGDRPEGPGEEARAARAAHPSVRVEVVAVGAEDAGEAVGRVGDLDLHPGQPMLEKLLEEAGAGRLGRRHAVDPGASPRASAASTTRLSSSRWTRWWSWLPARKTKRLPGSFSARSPADPADESTASPTEAKRKSKRSPSRITSSTPSRAGANRSRKKSSRRRSRPVQAPKCVSEMTSARKEPEFRRAA